MDKALLVIDMLNDFVHPQGTLYFPQGEAIIPNIDAKIIRYRTEGNLIVYICDSHDLDDKEFDRFPPHAVKGTSGAAVIFELAPLQNEMIVEKQRYSGFYNTNLINFLRRVDNPIVEVVGVCTSICVMDTVGGLVNRDYKVVVPRDCVADFDQEMHEFALKRMKNIYGAEIV
ncbi:hypothetical protein LCGC14_1202200 [marine sediment metagenome]|uniref:Isochorismatase-like domain-containing protein n=1 Tax=marine sediment metagenome TaxID=412755 RepID=A0A0F9NYZ0_9ZZZZ